MRSASSSVVPEEGRPVLGGTDRPQASPAGGGSGGARRDAKHVRNPPVCARQIGIRDGAPARVKQCKYQQNVANDLQSELGGRARAPQWSRNATRRGRSLHGFATID